MNFITLALKVCVGEYGGIRTLMELLLVLDNVDKFVKSIPFIAIWTNNNKSIDMAKSIGFEYLKRAQYDDMSVVYVKDL